MYQHTALVLAITLFCLESALAQRSCFPGTFRDGKKCTACPPGTFSNRLNLLKCRRCSPGFFRATEGARSEEQCLPCPAGTFSNKSATKSCTPCPSGKDSKPGATACAFCPAGSFLSSFGCSKCLRAFFSDKPGSKSCKRCPDGTFTGGGSEPFPVSGVGATSCTKCPPGTFRRNSEFDFNPVSVFLSNRCVTCQPGTFNDKPGSKSCKLCRPGSFSKKGAKECTPCPKGTFSNHIPGIRCRTCPSGTTTAGPGASACRHPSKGCTFDTFEDNNGNCKACMPGEKLDLNGRKCVPCGSNKFSSGGTDTECKACPRFQMPIGDLNFLEKSGCECQAGYIFDGTDCRPCPPGSFWENDNSFFLTTDNFQREDVDTRSIQGICSRCPLGTFSDKPGMLFCKPCPVGTFQDVEGGSECMKCPPGSRSPRLEDDDQETDRGKCVVDETGCRVGEIRNRRGDCEAVSCPSKNSFLVDNECISCDISERAAGKKGCVRCKRNERSTGGASAKCAKCPRGRVHDFAGFCECKSSKAEFEGKCVSKCPPGTGLQLVGSLISFGNEVEICLKCPMNTITTKDRPNFCRKCGPKGISPDRIKCIACPRGQIPENDIYGRNRDACRPSNPYL